MEGLALLSLDGEWTIGSGSNYSRPSKLVGKF